MRIEADSVLHHPRERVFEAYRDDLTAFVGYLPNVREIEVVARTEEGPIVRLHNVWRGGVKLPDKLQEALSRRFFGWDDHAVWDARAFVCTWAIEPHAFERAVTCRGQSEFIAIDERRTRVQMRGELAIDLGGLKGVPSALAGPLGRAAEVFVVRQITQNLAAVTDALASYLKRDTIV